MAQPVVGEMEMHSVANLATVETPLATFFPREVLLSQHVHTPLSLSPYVCSVSVQHAHTHISLSASA